MKKKIILGIILLLLSIIIIDYYSKTRSKKNIVTIPTITLKGPTQLELPIGTSYQELGYLAIDDIDGDITKKVTVNNTLNNQVPGTYQITYTVINSNHKTATTKRFIKVIPKIQKDYQPKYDKIDNTMKGWWPGNKKDNNRPITGAGDTIENLKQYNAYYMGEDKKIIYLTFDEGSNDTYMKEIVEVLNQNNVRATFFLCRGYIKSNPDLMKLLVETGHSVGNHTANHVSMPTLATSINYEKFLSEITLNEETFKEITGIPMDKVYREPKGEYSYRSLAIVKDLGYKSYFWSASYDDFHDNLSKQEALTAMMKRYHNGAIYLLHPKNKGNYEALDEFIKNMKNLGYEFGLVKDIS